SAPSRSRSTDTSSHRSTLRLTGLPADPRRRGSRTRLPLAAGALLPLGRLKQRGGAARLLKLLNRLLVEELVGGDPIDRPEHLLPQLDLLDQGIALEQRVEQFPVLTLHGFRQRQRRVGDDADNMLILVKRRELVPALHVLPRVSLRVLWRPLVENDLIRAPDDVLDQIRDHVTALVEANLQRLLHDRRLTERATRLLHLTQLIAREPDDVAHVVHRFALRDDQLFRDRGRQLHDRLANRTGRLDFDKPPDRFVFELLALRVAERIFLRQQPQDADSPMLR